MELRIAFELPDDCDFITYYRRKGDDHYDTAPASATGITILTPVSGSFEGYNVCSTDPSVSGYPWGVNGYNKLTAAITVDYRGCYLFTINSTFKCPYNLIIQGRFSEYSATASRYIHFEIIYKRGSTGQTSYIFEETKPRKALSGTSYTQPEVTAINTDFKKDTDFAYTDPYFTPDYLGPHVDAEPTWDEDPLSLPSTSIDYFSLDEDDDTQLTLILSWIQAVVPVDQYLFWLYSEELVASGSNIPAKGLNSLTIDLSTTGSIAVPREFWLRTSGYSGWLGEPYRITLLR